MSIATRFKMQSFRLVLVGAALVTALSASTAKAVVYASDQSSNSPYNGNSANWVTGSNGGFGFGTWTLETTGVGGGGYAGTYIGTNGSIASVATAGSEFGMYGAGTAASNAYRSITGTLAVNRTFSIDIAAAYRNGYKGIDIFNTNSNNIFNFNIGGDQYAVNNAASGNGNLNSNYGNGNTVFHLSFTQTSTSGGTWQIDRTGDVIDTRTGTFTGVIDFFHLYVGGTDYNGGSPNDLVFNNLSVTPEPSSAMLVLGGGLLGLTRRRRSR